MIDTIHANNGYNPNFHFNRKFTKSEQDLTGNSATNMAQIMWLEDMVHISGGSKLTHTAMMPASWMVKNKDWSEKLAKIKERVISGRYEIDTEKLAEKMMGRMAGVLMTR